MILVWQRDLLASRTAGIRHRQYAAPRRHSLAARRRPNHNAGPAQARSHHIKKNAGCRRPDITRPNSLTSLNALERPRSFRSRPASEISSASSPDFESPQ